ncbi:MAG: hypothetical protein COX19_17665 [Desulfobacterales bacterium CG23_combo_of_CG06-09_8_20_14_all_51_8]|nr:MAG: hypothetical protein COX19_17665 [Desulfobacterales bacterium CG23_combo_of_CG06-09_8_20_14_all_51_8]
MHKRLICPQRIRKVPKQFSWVDHRLVRDHYIDQCGHAAAKLYLFLVTVADAKGLSYYADRSIARRLSFNDDDLQRARSELIRSGLIAWEKPLYQVLSIEPMPAPRPARPAGEPQLLANIFRQIIKEAP